jgi:hypothetical protein
LPLEKNVRETLTQADKGCHLTELNMPFSFIHQCRRNFRTADRQLPQRRHSQNPAGRIHRFSGFALSALFGAAIRPMDNIPVVSFLMLRGRCRNCAASISWRYPAVELLTAAIFTVIVLKTGLTWEAGLEMVFASVMISLVFIDAIHHLLPNVITYPAIVFALAAATGARGLGRTNQLQLRHFVCISKHRRKLSASFSRSNRRHFAGGCGSAVLVAGSAGFDSLQQILRMGRHECRS